MPLGLLPICQCPIYLNGSQDGGDSNPSSHRFLSDCPHERFAKKIRHPLCGQNCHSFSQPSTFGNDTKKQEMYLLGNDILLLPEENNSYTSSLPTCQPSSVDGILSDDASIQVSPLRDQAVQELLKQFSGNKKNYGQKVSLGRFKEQMVIKFRRALYFSGLQVLYVRGGGFYRHISADYFQRNPSCLQRLVPWLKRELIVMYGDYGYTAKKILSIVLQNMTEYDLDSHSFAEILQPYLLKYTAHFLHEFISFARSPFSMGIYDQRAIYECPSSYGRCNLFTISPTNEKCPLPALENYSEMAKTIHDSWNKGILTHSSSKNTMASESSSVSMERILEEPSGTRNKSELRIQGMSESGDSKSMISSQSCPYIAHFKSMTMDTIEFPESPYESNRYTSERKTEGRMLMHEKGKDLGDDRGNYSTCNLSTTRNFSLRESKILPICQPMKTQERELVKNNICPLMMKETHQSLFQNSSQKQGGSWRCYSENTHSHKMPSWRGQRVHAFRKERLKCQPSCHSVILNTQPHGRLKSLQTKDCKNCLNQGSSQSSYDRPYFYHRPKKRRSRNRDHNYWSLKGKGMSEPLLTISCEAQEGDSDNGDDDYSHFMGTDLATTRELFTAEGRVQRLCNREKAFGAKSSNICLLPENRRSNCQCKRRLGSADVGRCLSHQEKMGKKRRFKCQHSERENKEKMSKNLFPATVQRHHIQESPSCYRLVLPKQCISFTDQASKHSIGLIKKRQEECE